MSDRIHFDGERVSDGQVDLDPLGPDRVVRDADVESGIVDLLKHQR